jgi:multidrug efflux system outer membrane protein
MIIKGGHAIRLCAILAGSIASAATALAQSGYSPPATFGRSPPPVLYEGNILPRGWPASRALEGEPAADEPVRWDVELPHGTPGTSRSQFPSVDLNESPALGLKPVDEEWWRMFRDPELDRLELLALNANENLQTAIARILQSRLQTRIVAADFFPHLDLTGQYSRSVSSDDGTIIHTSDLPPDHLPTVGLLSRTVTQNEYRAGLNLSWELDVFGRIRAAYAGGQARTQAALADARGVRLSIAAELASAYFALHEADEQIAILDETVALRREALALNTSRTGVGIGLPDDIARASLELHTAEAQLADAHRERNAIESDLALLCGQPAPDFHVAARPLHEFSLPILPPKVPAALLTRRPDVVGAERRLAGAIQDIREARAEEMPRVTVTGFLGNSSEAFDRLSNYHSHEAEIMPVISIPLFEGGRLEAGARLAAARRDELADEYKEAVLTGFREAGTAIDDMEQRGIQGAALSHGVQDAQVVLDYSNTRYAKQAASYFQVVTDEANLLNIQLQAAAVLGDRFEAAVSLARALGGGWSEETPAPTADARAARAPKVRP